MTGVSMNDGWLGGKRPIRSLGDSLNSNCISGI